MTLNQQPEPLMEPILSHSTVRITVGLFLSLLTLGVALLLWSEIHPFPEGAQILTAIDQFSMITAILLVLYIVFASRLYRKRAEALLELCYLRGASQGRRQAAEQLDQDRYNQWVAWMEWKEEAEAALREDRPEPNPPPRPGPPGVEAPLPGLTRMGLDQLPPMVDAHQLTA